jgi:hypothetical protein
MSIQLVPAATTHVSFVGLTIPDARKRVPTSPSRACRAAREPDGSQMHWIGTLISCLTCLQSHRPPENCSLIRGSRQLLLHRARACSDLNPFSSPLLSSSTVAQALTMSAAPRTLAALKKEALGNLTHAATSCSELPTATRSGQHNIYPTDVVTGCSDVRQT